MAEHRTGWTAQEVLGTRNCSHPSCASCSWSEYTTEQIKQVCDSDITPLPLGSSKLKSGLGAQRQRSEHSKKNNDSATSLLRSFKPLAYLDDE